MKSSSLLPRALASLACVAALITASTVRAQSFFDIHLNTSPLIGHAAGPFYLDFQLNAGTGGGNANNTAILSQFNFGGGSAFGSTNAFGGVTGNLASSVTLTDTASFNEFFQAFTPGTTLSFHLSLTDNANPPTPDLFSFAILDSDLFNIPTLAPGTDALFSINLTGGTPFVSTYPGSGVLSPEAGGPPIALAAPSVMPVPEPSAYGLMGAVALAGAIAWKRRRVLGRHSAGTGA